MTRIEIDGVTYAVAKATADPSEMQVLADGQAIGSIGRFGEQYRFSEPDGRATTIVRPRSDDGIEQIVRDLHAQRRA